MVCDAEIGKREKALKELEARITRLDFETEQADKENDMRREMQLWEERSRVQSAIEEHRKALCDAD